MAGEEGVGNVREEARHGETTPIRSKIQEDGGGAIVALGSGGVVAQGVRLQPSGSSVCLW